MPPYLLFQEPILIEKEITDKTGKTAAKILKAARALFAEKGYSGTRIDEIATRAGVNKATLYYQIGDKDTLYASVIHQVVGNVAQDVASAVAAADEPEEKLKAYIICLADAVDQNPEWPPIMMREIASDGANLPQVVIVDIASVLAILIGILDEGTQKEIFAAVPPFLVQMMIMGTILFYKKASPIKDKQLWIPEELIVLNKKLKGSLGEEVANLVLKAIKK